MNRYVHTTIKMGLASFITIMLSQLIGLDYAITAGILAVLSIQLTRRDSYILAIKRLLDACLAILLFTLLFVIFDYSIFIFALGTVVFIAISFALKIDVGIVPALVLASHLLLNGDYQVENMLNSFLLIFIATIVALVLNVLYPLNTKKALEKIVERIDSYIKEDLQELALCMGNIPHISSSLATHAFIHQKLESILYEAELNDKDILFDQNHKHMSYIHMRQAQMSRIHQIYELLVNIPNNHPNVDILKTYIEELQYDIGKDNLANVQLIKLHTMLEEFKASELPKTRSEFETRAVLYQIIFELEAFLEEKTAFHQHYANL